MRIRALLVLFSVLAFVGLTSCSKFKTYDGPEVTRLIVFKEARTMYVMHNDEVLETFPFHLGFTPVGHKQEYGDGRTPEGSYIIDRKNPDSQFHLSLGISYPDVHDRTAAREAGTNPGGDIFIHGGPVKAADRNRKDWTAGCIAVTNNQIEDLYAMVKVGTPIDILP